MLHVRQTYPSAANIRGERGERREKKWKKVRAEIVRKRKGRGD